MDKHGKWAVVERQQFLKYLADLVQIVSQIFNRRDEMAGRRLLRQNAPTLARKVSESALLPLCNQLLVGYFIEGRGLFLEQQ